MSWQIHCVKNTVKVSKACAEEIFEKGVGDWGSVDEFYDEGRLFFNVDHGEHQDYLSEPFVCKALKKYKVKGDVCWVCEEGDDAGKAWGYRFDGKGGMVTLKGTRTWKVSK